VDEYKCKSTKKKSYQNPSHLLSTVRKTISLLEYQGTRNFRGSVNFLTLLEVSISERVWRDKGKRGERWKEKKTIKTIIWSNTSKLFELASQTAPIQIRKIPHLAHTQQKNT
jgi:hypothetical protein